MTLQEKIQSELADAMRSKDQLRLSVLRMMKAAVKNKEVDKMKPLEEREVLAVLNTLIKQRKDSVEQFRKGGREELAQKEEALERRLESVDLKERDLQHREADVDVRNREIAGIVEHQKNELQRIAGMTAEEARGLFLKAIEEESRHEAAKLIRDIEEEAKREADRRARNRLCPRTPWHPHSDCLRDALAHFSERLGG